MSNVSRSEEFMHAAVLRFKVSALVPSPPASRSRVVALSSALAGRLASLLQLHHSSARQAMNIFTSSPYASNPAFKRTCRRQAA